MTIDYPLSINVLTQQRSSCARKENELIKMENINPGCHTRELDSQLTMV